MTAAISVEEFRKGYLVVLATTVEQSRGYYLDPAASLFEVLASVSAEEASRPVGGKGATLSAQVNHLRFYIDVRNEEIRTGESREVDWASSWQVGAVTAEEWQALLIAFRAAYEEQRAFILQLERWDEWAIGDAFALLGHCAYHLGEIRQGLSLLRG